MATLKVDVAVVGGGPGGLAAAKSILTARPDLRVAVFERAANIRAPRGASLGLLPNGFKALQAIDPALRDRVVTLDAKHELKRLCTASGVPMAELTGLAAHGGEAAQFGDYAHLSWHDLRLALAESLPEGVVQQGLGFEGYEEAEGGLSIRFRGAQGEEAQVQAQLLVGCDGNQSRVRQQLFGDGPPAFIGTVIWRTVLPTLPPCWDGSVPASRLWLDVKGSQGFCAFSLPGGRLSLLATSPWTADRLDLLADSAYIQDEGERTEWRAAAKQRCREAFAEGGWPAEVKELIETMDPATLTEHAQYYRDPAACREWVRGRVGLLGDAAHLSTPFLAQGTSQAFEDALELGRAIYELGPTPEALLQYQAVRQPQNAPVHEASVHLFKEFVAGRGQPQAEQRTNIDRGFVGRQFEPLPRKAAAAAAAQEAAQASVSA